MNNIIKVEQALHGYANGHQLLASSVELNTDEKRRMDELSDLSGICEEKQVVDYYTGYPLSGGKKYVIAKTWYAYEKQRPGCVWTQSLILDTEDVGRISCMSEFERMFRRPSGNDYGEYARSLLYQNTGDERLAQYDMEKLQYVIYTLFSSSKPRYVRASGGYLDEELLLMLKTMPGWLLGQFSFCTMAYDARRLGENEFSYQIIGKSGRYKADRDAENIHYCEELSRIKSYPVWISEYCKYMQRNCLHLLHDYMKQYGEGDLDFSWYSAMTRLYFAVQNTTDITLENYFDYADIVRKQTNRVFYEKTTELILDGILNIFAGKEYEIWDMLERKKIKLNAGYQKKLSEKTVKHTPEKLRPILKKYIEGKLSSDTKTAVERLIMDLKPEQLKKVSGMEENICVVLISQNSRLLLSEDIWKESKKFQQTILAASDRSVSDEILGMLISEILRYDKECIADTLFAVYGARMLPHIYEALKKQKPGKRMDVGNWENVLLTDQKRLLENMLLFQETPAIKKLFLSLDTSQDQIINAIDGKTWKKLYKEMQKDMDVNLAIQFFPVVLKTDYLNDVATKIVLPVYHALETDSLPFEQWNRIQPLLPEVAAYQSWDKCLRVRLALEKKNTCKLADLGIE